ncbi:hypothetical protein [Vibrio comitans]|uniref:Uncharacterized protein n=1 Tax=Vibrio comitans NBRC 102076 TaxID=1219078 RepID=A0A4Y3IKD7_9VIBR|nr:hypothetical protein [Vibrio comitans]GEA59836.1 hypothetical protein VCO01S_10290 [Vibrio comitans NBRC 102076]
MKKLIIIAAVIIVGGLFIWNNNTALAKVCSSIDAVQNQFPADCTKARALSVFE